MTLLIIYVLIALVVSFFCSLLEASLLTITPSAIQSAKARGQRWAVRMEKLKAEIDRPISAILTLNTIAHTMGAAGAGAQYARVYGNAGEAVFAGLLTLAILVLTEIIPKTLGVRYVVPLSAFGATVLPLMIKGLAPLVWLSRILTRVISRGEERASGIDRDELLAMARLGAESGQLRERESQFVQNLIQLNAMTAGDIMTPRTVIFALPESMRVSETVKLIEEKPFNRIPVYSNTRDEITGFVIRIEVLLAHLKNSGEDRPLADLKRPIGMAPVNTPVDALFQRLIAERRQLMIVIDEFGTPVGLASFEDVIETIFGFEIMDEKDKVPDLQLHARHLWKERARKMGIELEEKAEGEPEPNRLPESGGAGSPGRSPEG